MPEQLIDTNIILRFLTDEPPDMAQRARSLFSDIAAGRTSVGIEDVVVAELVWTLRSFYKISRADIAKQLRELLSDPNISNPDMGSLHLALVLYQDYSLDFADALLAARALIHGNTTILSFDRGFDRVPGLIRREPG